MEPLYPVCRVDHGLDAMVIVQVCEVQLVGAVVTPALDCPVITAPFVAE